MSKICLAKCLDVEMMFIIILVLTLGNYNAQTLNATISTTSAEYYITSQDSQQFANGFIQCTSSTCSITCDVNNSCEYLSINASLSSDLFLECNAYKSCYQASIISGPQSSVIINCLEENACENTYYNIQNTPTVDIECYALCTSGCLAKEAACYYAIFNAQYSHNVNVSCSDVYDCTRMTLNVNHTQTVTVTSIDNNYDMTVFGIGITNSLTMNCIGKYSCFESIVYCPETAHCNLNCIGNNKACFYSNYFIATENTSYVNITCVH
eukprot:257713_1